MTVQEALDELASFLAATPDLEAATVARPAAGAAVPEARTLSLADDAESFFRDVITAAVHERIGTWALKPLDPVYKPDRDELEWASASDVPAIEAARERYANLGPLQPFRPDDEDYKRRLNYWVCVLTGRDERKAFFFRAFSAAAELERKRGAALVSKNGSFTKVEDRIFLFDDAVDCFIFESYLFVIRKYDYRRVFDQLDAVRVRARAAAQALHARVPIANFDDFAEACAGQAAMADKLLAVRGRDYFATLSYEMLKPIIEEFSLGIPVQMHNGQPQLVFRPEPAYRWRILRLVDDDYLKSSMTEHRYEVNSKSNAPV
jgi:hypothetical protein